MPCQIHCWLLSFGIHLQWSTTDMIRFFTLHHISDRVMQEINTVTCKAGVITSLKKCQLVRLVHALHLCSQLSLQKVISQWNFYMPNCSCSSPFLSQSHFVYFVVLESFLPMLTSHGMNSHDVNMSLSAMS